MIAILLSVPQQHRHTAISVSIQASPSAHLPTSGASANTQWTVCRASSTRHKLHEQFQMPEWDSLDSWSQSLSGISQPLARILISSPLLPHSHTPFSTYGASTYPSLYLLHNPTHIPSALRLTSAPAALCVSVVHFSPISFEFVAW